MAIRAALQALVPLAGGAGRRHDLRARSSAVGARLGSAVFELFAIVARADGGGSTGLLQHRAVLHQNPQISGASSLTQTATPLSGRGRCLLGLRQRLRPIARVGNREITTDCRWRSRPSSSRHLARQHLLVRQPEAPCPLPLAILAVWRPARAMSPGAADRARRRLGPPLGTLSGSTARSTPLATLAGGAATSSRFCRAADEAGAMRRHGRPAGRSARTASYLDLPTGRHLRARDGAPPLARSRRLGEARPAWPARRPFCVRSSDSRPAAACSRQGGAPFALHLTGRPEVGGLA